MSAPGAILQAARDLEALAGEGLTLVSPAPPGGGAGRAPPASSTPWASTPFASTLVQADGDIVTRISPAADAAALEAHMAMVAARLRGLGRLAAAPGRIAAFVRVCVLNAAFLTWDGAGAGAAAAQWAWTVALPLLAPLAREAVRRGLIGAAKWKLGL
ncbi:hypothetical protein ACQ5SO_14390 [Rhodovulum sp. DZ06]|uniref:hypothetical protein n=1 Tax=Rhodovulum sp. DZ06 TaxID=3425126 RepID=UPI003D34FD51